MNIHVCMHEYTYQLYISCYTHVNNVLKDQKVFIYKWYKFIWYERLNGIIPFCQSQIYISVCMNIQIKYTYCVYTILAQYTQ